jgi:nitrous oxidase accessory protein NosD
MRPAAVTASLAGALTFVTFASGCGETGHSVASTAPSRAATTIRVPQDVATIAAAVRQAKTGALILISPGVYRESVAVRAPRVTLRGLDRNKVIIDAGLRANAVVLAGSGDAVQNLTVRNAVLNGILVSNEQTPAGGAYSGTARPSSPPLRGFVVDHVTSYNNGLYGIYAFYATEGTIRHSYTSGMADSGIYVGQCKPCSVTVHGNVAERNAVGYEATNASGRMYVYGNRFTGNRIGATIRSSPAI